MIGRTDLLEVGAAIEHWKARGVDLTHVLHYPEVPEGAPRHRIKPPPPVLDDHLDWRVLEQAAMAVEQKEPTRLEMGVRNVNRCVGGVLSSRIAQHHGAEGLPADTLEVDFIGSAGQSFGGWLAPGVSFTLHGDANDYTGKGLSGGVLAVLPRDGVTFAAEDNVIVGNTVLYGATDGKAFFRGRAGERFAVRNSGANAVVEGVGDHGCEYMTGGRVVVLGATGRNFAAGMSGGDAIEARDLIAEHVQRTGSPVGRRVLDEWDALLPKFVKVFPTDYKRVLAELAAAEAENAGETAAVHNDHPQSTGGEGFVTTEGEVDDDVVPSADTGASGDAARDGRIAPEPTAEEVRADG
jgi:glutamate synthase (NADPH/NADH) large chain/glutamate synthase (ferredoxin)